MWPSNGYYPAMVQPAGYYPNYYGGYNPMMMGAVGYWNPGMGR
jgi:hypothetical protein